MYVANKRRAGLGLMSRMVNAKQRVSAAHIASQRRPGVAARGNVLHWEQSPKPCETGGGAMFLACATRSGHGN